MPKPSKGTIRKDYKRASLIHSYTIVFNKYEQTKFTLKGPSGSIEANQEQDKRCSLSILLLNMILVATDRQLNKSKSEKKLHEFCLDLIWSYIQPPPKDTSKIWHTENPKDTNKNLVVLIKISEKIKINKGHKTNIQKLHLYMLANHLLKKLNNLICNSKNRNNQSKG